jgi:hypothetical protein
MNGEEKTEKIERKPTFIRRRKMVPEEGVEPTRGVIPGRF